MKKIAVVGATGLVGQEFLKILQERRFYEPKFQILKFASKDYPDQNVFALDSSWDKIAECDFVLNASHSEMAIQIRERLKENQILIDNSSAFRLDPEVPLVVPEINAEQLASKPNVIANPNCTAILLCLTLAPLRKFEVHRVVVATYQAASGAGIAALEELDYQLKHFSADGKYEQAPKVFRYPLAGNVFSHNTDIRPSDAIGAGYNEEEWKVIEESRKILGIRHLTISPTCMRVPVLRAHTEAVTVDFKKDIPLASLQQALQEAPGLKWVNDPENHHFPMPLEAQNQDLVLVGRLRKDVSLGTAAHYILCGDQIRKGAATNAVQILELLVNA